MIAPIKRQLVVEDAESHFSGCKPSMHTQDEH